MADEQRALADVYFDVMMDEPIDLPAFMARVGAGEFGGFTADEIREFLRGVQQDILGSIATKAGAMSLPGSVAEDRAEEAREMIEGLIRKYAPRA